MDWTKTKNKGVVKEYFRRYFNKYDDSVFGCFFEGYKKLIIFWVKIEYHRPDFRELDKDDFIVRNLIEFFGNKETGKILVSVTMRYSEIWNDFLKEVVPDINERKNELARGKR